MSSEKKECSVCCNTLSKFVKCLYCSKYACKKCYETYIIDQNTTKCMFCSKEWNIEFVQSNFTKVFVDGKLKKHKEQILLEREKAMMPATQEEFAIVKHNEELNKKIKEAREKISELKQFIHNCEWNKRHVTVGKKEERQQINYPCPNDKCRGFLNNWTCGICSIKVCRDCREEIKPSCNEEKEEHKCDPNVVESIKEIQKDSKPCPKCACPISKISGCDQMWCTICKTAFSWRTGRIEEGNIHNPHYWEYMTKRGQDLEALRAMENGQRVNNRVDRECIDMRYIASDRNIIRNKTIRELCRLFIHFTEVERRPYVNENIFERNKDIRFQYLDNKIEEDKMKQMIYVREKKVNFNEEMLQILDAFYDMTKDIMVSFFMQYLDDRNILLKNPMNVMIMELVGVCDYIQESMNRVCKRYDYKLNRHTQSFIKIVREVCIAELMVSKK